MFSLCYEKFNVIDISSVQSVVSDSLRPHGPHHARLPCPSPIPRACSNSCLLSQWYYPTFSSSIVPFSCLQSCPTSESFPVSQFFASGGQSIGASVQPQSFQWIFRTDFHYDWLVCFPCCPRDFQESSPAPQFESITQPSSRMIPLLMLDLSHHSTHYLQLIGSGLNIES